MLLFDVVIIVLALLPHAEGSSSYSTKYCANNNILLPKQDLYDVIVTKLDGVGNNDGSSLISYVNGSSDFQFNFNAPWFPSGKSKMNDNHRHREGLIVRVVDKKLHPEWSNAGGMAVVPITFNNNNNIIIIPDHVSQHMITWAGAANNEGPAADEGEIWGAADPRITYRPYNQLYYMTWDNCTKNCWPQRITYLSTTTNPLDPSRWTFHGSVFPFDYTSGAALLFRDDDNDYDYNTSSAPLSPSLLPHLAFVCNSNTADTILIAESYDGLNWTIPTDVSRRVLMKGRPGCWDSHGVALGPQPELIKETGDYLLIYNIDTGWPYHPNPLGRCAIGWTILDGDDPTKIVARATKPLLIATRPWERCDDRNKNKNDDDYYATTTTNTTTDKNNNSSSACQVPMVVFASGLKPLPNTENEFMIFYGGADSVVAVSKIKVNIINNAQKKRNKQTSFDQVYDNADVTRY